MCESVPHYIGKITVMLQEYTANSTDAMASALRPGDNLPKRIWHGIHLIL